jgi:2-methylcitrate dehydratase PrpD
MARNTRVDADHDAPPITRTLANFVATHPSRGWSDAVEREAHRSLLNWMGCAVGAAGHESVHAALAAVQMLQPAPQAQVPGPRLNAWTWPARRCWPASRRTPSTSTTRT